MRIAVFTETFLPKVDGIVNTLCHLLEHLDKRKHTSLLFAPSGGPEKMANTEVVSYPGLPFPLYPELKLVPPTVNIEKQLRDFKPDVIHILNPISFGLKGLFYARRQGVPVVASYHTDVPGFAARWGLGWSQTMLWAYLRSIHNQADLNLCPSRATQRELIANGFQRIRVWGRGVDTELFNLHRFTHETRLRLSGGYTAAPLLLYVGRLSPEKRIHWLRDVFEKIPNVRLAIVGDGPARAALERLFAGTPTHFTGMLQGKALAQAYASADIFTFPAANETLGNVVLEAMASGLPVVAPRSGGVLDHIVHGETGLLTEPESQPDFIEAVTQLATYRQRARQLGKAGLARVAGRSWESVLDGLLDDYLNLVNRPDRVPVLSALRPQTWTLPE